MNDPAALEKRDFPDKPGVYIMKDAAGATIYVGKAKSLKHRVRSYFVGEKDIKTRFLVATVADIEVIITNSEYEALLLENNLIKQWKPRFNINLKDGKTYPVIRLTNEEFPRVYRTRRILFDGSEYFGPFPKPQQIDLYLKLIEKHFRLCKYRGSQKQRKYPCLNYHMGRCAGACCGKISREDYLKIVDGVRKLLSGKSDELLRELTESMKAASEALDFERAAGLRDRISAIQELFSTQRVMEFSEADRDYVALAPSGDAYVVVVLQVREGKLLGKEVFRVEEYANEEETLSHFIARYYAEITMRPDEVYVAADVDAEDLTAMLSELAGKRMTVWVPQRGKHVQLITMARENAREEAAKLAQGGAATEALQSLARALDLPAPPRRIEGFDIAHLGGTDTVASLVSFKDGRPDRRMYRSFTIKSLGGKIDDFESMREVVARRYARVVNEELEVPDLILIDGGKGQLSAAKGILDGLDLSSVAVIGLAKKKEEIFVPGKEDPIVLEEGSPALLVLQAVRNESHRFATTLHKKKRAKRVRFSLLEGIPGIGQRRSRKLLEVFGSLEAILAASPEEIVRKSGIPTQMAADLISRLKDRLSAQAARE